MSKILKAEEFTAKYIKLNEGAGAGYDVTLNGLKIDKNSVNIIGETNNKVAIWEAKILPCVVDEWKAIGYYDGITSDTDDKRYFFTDGDKKVNGGLIRGIVDLDDIEEDTKNGQIDEISIINYIKDNINDTVDISSSFGWGWVHIDLDDEFELGYNLDCKNLKNFEYGMYVKVGAYHGHLEEIGNAGGEYYGELSVYYAKINAPVIAHCINDYFEHKDDEFDEIEESYKPVDIVDVDRELQNTWEKVYKSIKKILATNGFIDGKILKLKTNNELNGVSLKDGVIKVFSNDEEFYAEDLEDAKLFTLYKDLLNTIQNIDVVIKSVNDFVKNHKQALDMFLGIYNNEEDYPTVEDAMNALRSLNTNGSITDIEYDYIVNNWDTLAKIDK